jgi:co-chaperonin GroES (HSP10)
MRAYLDSVILKPREDLDQKWNSSLIITPDSATTGANSMGRADASAVCEVMSIGPGSEECPDLPYVKVGDIVILPLYGASKVIVLEKEIGLLIRFRGIAGVVRELGTPHESIVAVNDYVLTRQDREAFETRMYGGLRVPDSFLDEGMPVDAGSDGIVRVCLERVISTGGGHRDRRGKRWAPEQEVGSYAIFNPLGRCRFRRNGQVFSLVPFEDITAGVDA